MDPKYTRISAGTPVSATEAVNWIGPISDFVFWTCPSVRIRLYNQITNLVDLGVNQPRNESELANRPKNK